VRPLRSTGITPLPHYYGPLRLPAAAVPWVMISPQELSQPTWTRTPRRASQVPRPISRRAPSPTTPDSPVGALARCFPTGSRLPPLWKVGHCQVSVTRPNRVRLTRAHVFTVRGFNPFAHGATDPANRPASRCQLPLARDRSSMPNEQFAWLTPFNQLDRPGLTWRTRGGRGDLAQPDMRRLYAASANCI